MYVYNLIIQYKVLYKPPTNTHTDYNMTIPCLVLVLVIKIINPLIIKKKNRLIFFFLALTEIKARKTRNSTQKCKQKRKFPPMFLLMFSVSV